MTKQPATSVPHHYSIITLETRQKLVDLVISMGFSIGRAARKLKVKLSTAKMIVRRFKTRGDFFESKGQRAERLNIGQLENSSKKQNNLPVSSQNCMEEVQPATQASPLPAEQTLLYFPLSMNEMHYWPWFQPQNELFPQGFLIQSQAVMSYLNVWQ